MQYSAEEAAAIITQESQNNLPWDTPSRFGFAIQGEF